jgi:hypothetical protein
MVRLLALPLVQPHPPPRLNQRRLCRCARVLQPVSQGSVLGVCELGARKCYGRLKTPPTPGLKVRSFCHGKRRRKTRKKVTVVLASFASHALRAHEALSRPDALSGFLEVVHRLVEEGVFVGHD